MNWRNLITLCKFAILILYCSNWNLSIHAFSQGLAILNAMDVHVTSPSRRTSAVKICSFWLLNFRLSILNFRLTLVLSGFLIFNFRKPAQYAWPR